MIEQTFTVAGDTVRIHTLERPADLDPLRDWFRQSTERISMDTETTGLNTWAPDVRVRLVQMGDANDAWVLPVGYGLGDALGAILSHRAYSWVTHNGLAFDSIALRTQGLLQEPVEVFARRVHDTKIMSHLIDPRSQLDGGVGHSLKGLTGYWVDPSAPDTGRELHKRFKDYRVAVPGKTYASGKRKGEQFYRPATVSEGWSLIDTFDPLYTLYAGLDVIFTSRLYEVLLCEIDGFGLRDLWEFERNVALVCLEMQANGMMVDEEYSRSLADHLQEEASKFQAEAANYGCKSVNAPQKVVEAFTALGATLTKQTKSGAPSVDSSVLEELKSQGGNVAYLAKAITSAKRSDKWRTAYVESMLDLRDSKGRVHPVINSLQAVTGRMSVSDPPFQQLPSKKDSGLGEETA